VFPALVLNYLGRAAAAAQSGKHGASILSARTALGAISLVGLATLATVIASQAVISGAYSLTRQATQLGYAPES